MARRIRCGIVPAVVSCLALLPLWAQAAEPKGVHWPSFRGPRASGVAEGFPTPVTWDAGSSTNIKWKRPIPGLGHACPVIWGDRLFVATAISGKPNPQLRIGRFGNIDSVDDETVHRWEMLCLDKKTGRVVWRKTAHTGVPRIKRHTKSTHANTTAATDGKHVVVLFGSEGLYCYDVAGKLLWKKDLGVLDSGYYRVPAAQWEFAGSPILHAGRVIVQCDVQENSFLAAFDVADGREIWRTPRDDVPTWSTPAVYEHDGQTRLVVNGYKHIGGYDLASGKAIWKLGGGGDIPVPTPVVGHGLLFICSAHGSRAPMFAVRVGASGDITLDTGATANEHIAWSDPRCGAYLVTPLVYGDYLYSCRGSGILTCYEARTGKRMYRERLGHGSASFTASIVAADDKLYLTSEVGDVYVVAAGPEFKVLATNALNETCLATPAISEGELFFRTRDHVVAVAASE